MSRRQACAFHNPISGQHCAFRIPHFSTKVRIPSKRSSIFAEKVRISQQHFLRQRSGLTFHANRRILFLYRRVAGAAATFRKDACACIRPIVRPTRPPSARKRAQPSWRTTRSAACSTARRRRPWLLPSLTHTAAGPPRWSSSSPPTRQAAPRRWRRPTRISTAPTTSSSPSWAAAASSTGAARSRSSRWKSCWPPSCRWSSTSSNTCCASASPASPGGPRWASRGWSRIWRLPSAAAARC